MSLQSRIVRPHSDRCVLDENGKRLAVPDGWEMLPPGDAALTRRVKGAGTSWTVQEKKGRRTFSRGVWAPAETIRQAREHLERERATPAYQKKRRRDAERRDSKQGEYVEDFQGAVVRFLRFDKAYQELASELAARVTAHATPVGSGTVARTRRIPIERRAESAVIAWLRHQTTAYDELRIPRVRGRRREVRRQLAEQSRRLLERYRRGEPSPSECPLRQALRGENRSAG